ncbi:MAG: acylphosphatase [Gammaproteobacteria bacterium]|nr:MAG: acylphosphatase [Gammaproteobacteria bacterium]
MICKRCIVMGRVQGVWYRDSTRRKALELGLSGRAVNLPDGSVEVLACGPEAAVQALCDWLWEGSPMSQVSDVRCEPWQGEVPEAFLVG